jgi:xylulokinase
MNIISKVNFNSFAQGCAQQHGSVYWKHKIGLERLKNFHSTIGDQIEISNVHNLPKNLFLVDLLKSSFSRIDCPIWMDSSTTVECQFMEKTLGSTEKLFQITGSKAYERFTGSQIMKIFQKTPEIYQQTECIQLISNFLASILLGDYAPIDLSDGSGMNLLDIRQHKWSKDCLDICGKDLDKKLSDKLVYPRIVLGTIARYFVERYAFNSNCQIVSFTGDNPSSYYALAADTKTVVINLGKCFKKYKLDLRLT